MKAKLLSGAIALSLIGFGCSNSKPGGSGPTQKAVAPVTSASKPAPVTSQAKTGFAPAASLQTPRGLHTATLLADGRVLVAGGLDTAAGGTFVSESEVFDPKKAAFTKTSDPSLGGSPGGYMNVTSPSGKLVPTGRVFHTATRLTDGRVLIAGGYGEESFDANGKLQTTDMATAFVFDPKTGSFAPAGKLATARQSHVAVAVGTGAVVAGGFNASHNNGQGGSLQSAETFDAASGSFMPLSQSGKDMAESRQACESAATGSGVLIVGGQTIQASGTQMQMGLATGAELFTGNGFHAAPKPVRDRVSATLTPTTKGWLLAGGIDGNGLVSEVEEIDSALRGWTTTAKLQQGRMHHAAAGNGVGVLLVGGAMRDKNQALVTLANGEFVDELTGTTVVYPMSHERNSTAAALLADGSILVTGGFEKGKTDPLGLDGQPVAASEIFKMAGGSGSAGGLLAAPGTAGAPGTPGSPGSGSGTTPAASRPTIRVAAGNKKAVTDSAGNVWTKDTGFSGGTRAKTKHKIKNTADPALYKHERNGTFTYTAAVPNGNYDVTLKFCEFYWKKKNKRIFNVILNGTEVLKDYDIFVDAGGRDRAVDHTFPVTVTNGQIEIQFDTVKDNAKISAILIEPK